MPKNSIIVIAMAFSLSIWATASTPVSIETVRTAPSNTPSAINLYCHDGDESYYQSRIALFRSKNKTSDYAVTTAHGIGAAKNASLENCHVQLFDKKYALQDVYIPENYVAGKSTDWAIVRLPRIKESNVTRYTLPQFLNHSQDVFQHEPNLVTFPRARGLGFNMQTCLSLPSIFAGIEEKNILAHDCDVIAGQSGSPLSISQNGEDILIGIHLGKSFMLKSPLTKRPANFGYFRFFDDEIVREIDSVLRGFQK